MARKTLGDKAIELAILIRKREKQLEIYNKQVKAYDQEMGLEYRTAKAIIQHIIGRKLTPLNSTLDEIEVQ